MGNSNNNGDHAGSLDHYRNKSVDELVHIISTLHEKNESLEQRLQETRSQYKMTQQNADNLQIILDGLQNAFQTGELTHYLEIITSQTSKLVGADRATLWLYDDSSEQLYTVYAEGLEDKRLHVPLENTLSGYSFLTNSVLNIKDAWHIGDEVPFKYNTSYDKQNDYRVKSVVCVPISIYDSEIQYHKKMGVLQVINKGHDEGKVVGLPFTDQDIRLLQTLSVPLCSLLDTIEQKKELQKTHQSTIETLVKTIEAKHRDTAGHSQNVRDYAVSIATAMDLSPEQVDLIATASILHDIGKIAIHDSVLGKRGLLTQGEYKEIQQHAQATYDILSQIHFPPRLKDVPLIASAHHEEDDGGGYPLGRTKESIPLEARILRVADVFDAITSNREYRTPMSSVEAIGGVLISTKIGYGAFDKETVRAFVASDTYQVAGAYKDTGYSLDQLSALCDKYMCDSKNLIDSFYQFLKEKEPEIYQALTKSDSEGSSISTEGLTERLMAEEGIKRYFLHMIDTDTYWEKSSPYRISGMSVYDYADSRLPPEYQHSKFLSGLEKIIHPFRALKERETIPLYSKVDSSQEASQKLNRFSIHDLYTILTSQKYTDKPVTLCQFIGKILPVFVKSGTVKYDDAYRFLEHEEWKNHTSFAPRKSFLFTTHDFYTTNKELKKLKGKKETVETEVINYMEPYLESDVPFPSSLKKRRGSSGQTHRAIKEHFIAFYENTLPSTQYLRQVDRPDNEGFSLYALTSILSNPLLANERHTPESVFLNIYKDYIKKSKLPEKEVNSYIETKEYLLPFYLSGNISAPMYNVHRIKDVCTGVRKRLRKNIKYDGDFLKSIPRIEQAIGQYQRDGQFDLIGELKELV